MLCRSIGSGGAIAVQDIDGSPSITGVTTLKFNNGSVTDLGGGAVQVKINDNFDGGNFADTYVASSADWDGGSF